MEPSKQCTFVYVQLVSIYLRSVHCINLIVNVSIYKIPCIYSLKSNFDNNDKQRQRGFNINKNDNWKSDYLEIRRVVANYFFCVSQN